MFVFRKFEKVENSVLKRFSKNWSENSHSHRKPKTRRKTRKDRLKQKKT
jgi:hypothetical protein